MVKINKIVTQPATLYGPGGTKIGKVTTEHSFNDVRIQIKEQKLSGYYFMFLGERIDIDSNGKCKYWPKGFFDTTLDQLCKLVGF